MPDLVSNLLAKGLRGYNDEADGTFAVFDLHLVFYVGHHRQDGRQRLAGLCFRNAHYVHATQSAWPNLHLDGFRIL